MSVKAPIVLSRPMKPTRRHGPPSVINVGLMRTGTMSMARAYDTLGLRAYHGLDMPDREFNEPGGWNDWAKLERAADATWPSTPGEKPTRFTRKDWDDVFGEFDVVTDVGAFFADQLVEVYPEAKVVIVQREFESWWKSFEPQVIDEIFSTSSSIYHATIGALTGFRAVETMRKTLRGAFDGQTPAEVKAHGREFHKTYHDGIRAKVSPEKRLEFRLGDGWEPLCAFLGKEVPDVPFPRVNDGAEHAKRVVESLKKLSYLAWLTLRPWVSLVVVLLVAVWWMV